jgi:transposase
MANRIKMVQQELLISLFKQNWSDRKIHKTIGLHRKTISRYRKEWLASKPETNASHSVSVYKTSVHEEDSGSVQNAPYGQNKVPTGEVVHFEVPTDPASRDERRSSKSKATVHHDIILTKLQNGQHAVSIYQDLVSGCQYAGGYDSIKRYVRKLKQKTPTVYARIETPPGDEAQVDFGLGAPTVRGGKYHKPWLFIMTLSNSRKSYQQCVWQQDVETFIRCHENAFTFFGGVPRIIRHDNLKSAVLKAHLYEAEMNPNYLAFADHFGFIPIPCKVRTPEHKGKVESNVKYVQNNALKGKRFDDLEKQNAYLRNWNKTWASTRIHGTTKRQVNLMFQEEQPHLRMLPGEPFLFFRIGTRKVSSTDSHVEVAGAYYPVSPQYMGKQVFVHYNNRWVKVFYHGELIQHLATIARGRFHPDRSCLPPHKNWQKEEYIKFLFRKCSLIGSSVLEWARLAEEHRKERSYRSIQGIVALARKYPYSIINAACQRSIHHNSYSYHVVTGFAESIRIERQVQQEINFTQESDYIRTPDMYQQLISGENHG